MKDTTKQFYNKLELLHKRTSLVIEAMKRDEQGAMNIYALIDSAYALRELIKLHEDTLKDLNKLDRVTQAKIGLIYLQASADGPIETEYCKATITVVQIPEIPKRHKDAARYDTFMRYLKIPENLIAADMIRLNWNSFIEWFNEHIAAGNPTPKGIDVAKVSQSCKVRLRKKKQIEFTE